MNIYQRLKDLREDHDLTQKEVAYILKMDQSLYSRYELGKSMMGLDKYIILAKYYNVSLDYLAGLIDRPRPLYRKDGERIKNSQQISHSHHFTITNK